MATTFEAKGRSNIVLVEPGNYVNYVLAVAEGDTWDATVEVYVSDEAGWSYVVVDTVTEGGSGSWTNTSGKNKYFWLQCTSFGDECDTITYSVLEYTPAVDGEPVTGDLSVAGELDVGSDLAVGGGLEVTGAVDLLDNLDVGGTLSVPSGDIVAGSGVTVTGVLETIDAAEFGSDVTVAGSMTVQHSVFNEISVSVDPPDSGETHTLTAVIPAGSYVYGICASVGAAIGGCTSINFGDGDTADLYGSVAADSGSTKAWSGSMTEPKFLSSSGDVVMTAVGDTSAFDETGDVTIYITTLNGTI